MSIGWRESDVANSRGLTAPGKSPIDSKIPPISPGVVGSRRIAAILVCGAILLLGLLWWFDPAKANWPMCTFHALTGLQCPGCGATRATHELLHGRLLAAWRYNALWVLSLPVALYAALSELRVLTGRRPLPGDLARQPWFWVTVVAAAAAFFVVRNLARWPWW